MDYLRNLTGPRFILWCYLIWWLGVCVRYFDPSPRLWANSLGIAAIIGSGLLLSTAYGGSTKVRLGRWAIARLYMMPFFVSSFSALIKGRDFVLIFHPDWPGNLLPLCIALSLGVLVLITKRLRPATA